ncbi:MAG: ComF family protein [Lachnospiraceae bacterium]|nr:ComF family protein [Lachnospiraceae bacterium]
MKGRTEGIRDLKTELKKLHKVWTVAEELLFPTRCAVCDDVTDDKENRVCRSCTEKIVYIKPPFCMKCGKQLWEEDDEYCTDCSRKKHFYIQGTALYEYGSMADSLFRFKYASRAEYACFYGRELWEKRRRWLLAIKPDALVPVPVHPSRKRKRGYNQASLIAKELSELSGIPVNEELIARTKRTKAQKELSERQRQNNLKKAFKILQNDVKLNTIVIIDDIYTTGSTIDAVAELLLQAGVGKVYYMVMAIGRG